MLEQTPFAPSTNEQNCSLHPGQKPYLKQALKLPSAATELFFDIEADPMHDICYLHGFVIREGGGNTAGERFVGFFADEATPEAERAAFAQAIDFFRKTQPSVVYYYSKYERTWFRKLQDRFPDVCTPEEIESLFAPTRSVDLYTDVILRATEWPTNDHSIKTLAKYLSESHLSTHPEVQMLGRAQALTAHRRVSADRPSPVEATCR